MPAILLLLLGSILSPLWARICERLAYSQTMRCVLLSVLHVSLKGRPNLHKLIDTNMSRDPVIDQSPPDICFHQCVSLRHVFKIRKKKCNMFSLNVSHQHMHSVTRQPPGLCLSVTLLVTHMHTHAANRHRGLRLRPRAHDHECAGACLRSHLATTHSGAC